MVLIEPPVVEGMPPVRWEIVELTSSLDLLQEGKALRHCVLIYDRWCCRGHSRIWSLRRRSPYGRLRSVATIEVDPWKRSVVQARGLRNKSVWGRPRRLLEEWARRESLRLQLSG
jgi:hypothetical protein